MTQSNKSKQSLLHSFAFAALGTEWVIESPQALTGTLRRSIIARLEFYDKTYSRFRGDSIVSRMAKSTGAYTFPEDFSAMFSFYQVMYDLTDRQVTPLIGRALEQAGYDKEYSLQPGPIGAVPTLEEALIWDGAASVQTNQPIVFDVGAAGKGHAVDIVAEILERANVKEYTIDASGDIRVRGNEPERIGLENPYDETKIIGVAEVRNRSLCASASNRRAWRDMHHIISPRTLEPVEKVIATWVIADNTMVADGLATALFFVDSPEVLLTHFDFSYVRIMRDETIDYSHNFEGELFA